MATLTSGALEHFERRHGIASLGQLLDYGMSREAIKKLVREGLIEQVMQGAYRLRGQPLTDLGRLVAVCTAHPGHVISGPSAGRLFALRRLPPDLRVHTISPPASHPTRARWVQPYRTTAFRNIDIVRRSDGIVHTGRPRTALDLARFVDNDVDLLSIIEQAMHDGRHSIEEMRAVALPWRSPRRGWLNRYLEVLDQRVEGGAAESHPEVELGDALRRAGVVGLVRQFAIDLPGFGRGRFDLAIPRLRWALEVDVFPTHRETAGRSSDERRDLAAQAIGWSIRRLGPDAFGPAFARTVRVLADEFQRRTSA